MTTLIKTIGSVATKIVSSSNYTILDSDGFEAIYVTTGASDRTVTLPASLTNAGRKLTIKKEDSGAGKILITRAGADLIDSASSYVLAIQYQTVTLVCVGNSWLVVASPSLYFFHTNDNGASGGGAIAEASFYNVVVPYTAIYTVTGCAQIYTGTSTGNVSSGYVTIKTGSATYASATYKVSPPGVQTSCTVALNRGITQHAVLWTGTVNGGDTIHYGMTQSDVVGTGGHSSHFFTVQEVRR